MVIQPGFYGILSNPLVGYRQLTAIMVREGVGILQLRVKHASRTRLLAIARQVRAEVPSDRLLVINDAPEVAREVGADGVHLGQDDPPLAFARDVLGPDAVIGISTHSVAQVRSACEVGPAYLGVGPVFSTTTKRDAEPAIGLETLARMCAAATVPTVAIGGVHSGNLARVLDAGVWSFCSVGPVNGSADPARVIRALRSGFADRA